MVNGLPSQSRPSLSFLKTLLKRHLSWLQPFVSEPPELDVSDGVKDGRTFPLAAITIGVLSALGLAIQTASLVSEAKVSSHYLPVNIALEVLWTLAAVIVAVSRPRTASLPLAMLFNILLFTQILVAFSRWSNQSSSWPLSGSEMVLFGGFIIALIAIVIALNMPIRDPRLSKETISRPFTKPTKELRSPEDNLTLWRWMTVSWMAPMIATGSKRQLNDEDVWSLPFEFQHRYLHDAFHRLRGTVFRRLIRANCVDLVILSLLALLELAANYSAPLMLQQLLTAMENLKVSKESAIFWAALIMCARLVAAQSAVFSMWFGRRCYERSRGEMITMLYEKTLNRKIVGGVTDEKEHSETETGTEANVAETQNGEMYSTEYDTLLNGASGEVNGSYKKRTHSNILDRLRRFFKVKQIWNSKNEAPKKTPTTMGKLLNLMRADVYEVAQRFWEIQTLVNKPVGLILSVVLVWRIIGWPSLVGIAVVVLAQIINFLLARIMMSWEKVRRAATDVRLQQTSQYIESIRHLRWYAWERIWLSHVMGTRQKELRLKVYIFLLNSAIVFTNQLSSGLFPVAAFWAYTMLAGRELRIEIAFPALELFALLQTNLKDVPQLITVLLNASVALGRIEEYMKEPDRVEEVEASGYDGPLELRHASFAWPGMSKNVLHDVTVTFAPGLSVIYGTVAAGKTALLQALLGELDHKEGELIRADRPVAYCSQTPWLQSMSVRENILFFEPMNEARYKATLDACELGPDLAMFEHGDLSPIGENGIGLSGGQKARVALARAIYSSSRTLFLDDPLSALDQATAKAIVAKLFPGPLTKGRTILLVTHRTDLCRHIADQFVEVLEGRVRATTALSFEANTTTLSKMDSKDSSPDVEIKSAEESTAPEKFETEEHRAHGGVQARVYWEYIKAGRLRQWALVVSAAILVRVFIVANTWFLKEWGEAYERSELSAFWPRSKLNVAVLSNPLSRFFSRFPNPAKDVKPWLLGFFLIVICQSVAFLIAELLQLAVQYRAGKKMFAKILESVSRATFRFYDLTPVGRLMNRLTSDIGTIDGNISWQLDNFSWSTVSWVASLVVIASVTPLFVAASLLLTLAFALIFSRFLPTSQSLRRLEMASLSPLMSNFGTLVHGLTTVRAFRAQSRFQDSVIAIVDTFQRMDHFYWSLQAWLMYRFDCLSALSTFLLTLLAVFSGLSAGLTAFVLTSAGKFVQSTHALCKIYGQLQLDFVSVERVVELIHIDAESPGATEPPAWWPSKDNDIVFEKVSIRYAPELEPALKDLSFTLKGGSTTAVVGRTGSGKSTLALALLATVAPYEGRILIGGIDINAVDKHILRSRITFLAQEPTLFPGTLKHNLDPTEAHTDEDCASVISRVCPNYGWTLSTEIEAGGKNVSQGQRQLIGLARAVLRRSPVVIMDEATASIDQETAWEIQRVLRDELRSSTVVTIAHRKEAVRDADICLVLDKGRLSSMRKPEEIGSDALDG